MLILQKIRFKNLLSFGNDYTSIEFNDSNSVLIQGSNGTGKSAAILDSLSFGLYNRPFRKVNKPNLVNYRNKKELVVEVWFSIGAGKDYHVVRGLNPQIFEIYENGVLINQNSAIRDYQDFFEKQILHLDFQAFTQIVVLGKATYIAFLKLAPQDRRRFIENVLGLTVFAQMSEINRMRLSELKTKQTENRNTLKLLKQEISLTHVYIRDFEEEMLRQQVEHARLMDEQISEYQNKNVLAHEAIATLESCLTEVSDELSALNQKAEICYDYQSRLTSKLKETRTKLNFFLNTDVCPTCEGVMNSEIKTLKMNTFQKKEQDLIAAQEQINEKLEALSLSIKQIQDDLKHNANIQNEIKNINFQIQQNSKMMMDLERRKSVPPVQNVEKIKAQKERLEGLRLKQEQMSDERQEINNRIECHDFITMMLKDGGIKSTIIRLYIPQITSIMNTYLRSLGLFVKFELDENFEEKLYARGIDELSYSSFSEGEKLRIDLAMLLTWREICKRKNNMNVNFLVFDEILDTSIDQIGIDSLLQIFKELKYGGTKVVLISHSDRWSDRFDEIWEVKKSMGFSSIIKC